MKKKIDVEEVTWAQREGQVLENSTIKNEDPNLRISKLIYGG